MKLAKRHKTPSIFILTSRIHKKKTGFKIFMDHFNRIKNSKLNNYTILTYTIMQIDYREMLHSLLVSDATRKKIRH